MRRGGEWKNRKPNQNKKPKQTNKENNKNLHRALGVLCLKERGFVLQEGPAQLSLPVSAHFLTWRVSSGPQNSLFWARPRETQPLYCWWQEEMPLPSAVALRVRWGKEPGQLLQLLLTPSTLLEVDLRKLEKLWQALLFVFGNFSLVFQGNEAVWSHCPWIHSAPSPEYI